MDNSIYTSIEGRFKVQTGTKILNGQETIVQEFFYKYHPSRSKYKLMGTVHHNWEHYKKHIEEAFDSDRSQG